MYFFIVLASLVSLPINAADYWDGQGEVALEARQFYDDDISSTEDTGLSVLTRVETSYDDEVTKFVFRGFARVDDKDSDRDFLALEDAYLSWRFGSEKNWRISAGYEIFNWTAMEAFQPADVINSRNFDSNLEKFEKLGELTFSIERTIFDGVFTLYFFPYFKSPQYPGARSRLGVDAVINDPKWVVKENEISGDNWGTQGGARLTQVFNDTDISLHILRHMDRDMPLVGTPTAQYLLQGFQNTPYYYEVTQAGGTLQMAVGDFILKGEAAYRDFDQNDLEIVTLQGRRTPVDHTQVAAGLEYLIPLDGLLPGKEITLYGEAQRIFGVDRARRAELSTFQNDLFLGLRFAFNDFSSSEIFFSFLHDFERENEHLYNLSYSRRITNIWKLSTGIRIYDAPKKQTYPLGLETFNKDHYGHITLSRFF